MVNTNTGDRREKEKGWMSFKKICFDYVQRRAQEFLTGVKVVQKHIFEQELMTRCY